MNCTSLYNRWYSTIEHSINPFLNEIEINSKDVSSKTDDVTKQRESIIKICIPGFGICTDLYGLIKRTCQVAVLYPLWSKDKAFENCSLKGRVKILLIQAVSIPLKIILLPSLLIFQAAGIIIILFNSRISSNRPPSTGSTPA